MVCGLAGGGFVIAWQSHSTETGHVAVFAQRFDATGSAAGDTIRVNADNYYNHTLPAIAALDGGGFVVSWQSHHDAFYGWRIFARVFDAQGSASAPEFFAGAPDSESQGNSSVAGLDDGGFVVAWQVDDWSGAGQKLYVRFHRFDADANSVGPVRRVDSSNEAQITPVVAAGPEGQFAIAWRAGNGWEADVALQGYNADGTRAGPIHRGVGQDISYEDPAALGILPSGEPGAVLGQRPGRGIPRDERQIFRSPQRRTIDSYRREPRQTIGSTSPAPGRSRPSAARATMCTSSTTRAIASSSCPARDTNSVVSLRDWTLGAEIEDLRLGPGGFYDGTGNALGNRIIGNGTANRLLGLAGNDTLGGNGYDDTLSGGTGHDRLLGGEGNDLLQGGADADTLTGGPGNDTLNGGEGADAFMFEVAGSGLLPTDFVPGIDRIRLDVNAFEAFNGQGIVRPAQFVAGEGLTAALTSGQRLVLNTSTGILYYDADGVGGAGAGAIARIGSQEHPQLGCRGLRSGRLSACAIEAQPASQSACRRNSSSSCACCASVMPRRTGTVRARKAVAP